MLSRFRDPTGRPTLQQLRRAFRYREPVATTDDALLVLDSFAALHGGDVEAALGEVLVVLAEKGILGGQQ